MSDPVFRNALLAALAVGMGLLLAYQGVMLWWTKKTVGEIPKVILWLRVFMMVLLVACATLVIWKLAG